MKTFLKTAAVLALGFTFQANAFADNKGHGQNNNHVSQVKNTTQVNQVKNDGKVVNQGTTIQKQVNNNIKVADPNKKGPINGGVMKKGNGPQGNQYKSYGKYESCKTFKDYKGPCYKGKGCNFWTTCSWYPSYGCNLYWCPTEYCWFYWCQPHGCYLPVEYVPCGGYVFVE